MAKKYKTKAPNRKILKKYWNALEILEGRHSKEIWDLEKKMAKETGIKDICFFSCDGEYVGIGNGSKTMKLVQDLRGTE